MYIFGVYLGDGWAIKNKGVGLGTASKEFAEYFKEKIDECEKEKTIIRKPKYYPTIQIRKRPPRGRQKLDAYIVICCSIQLVKLFLRLEKDFFWISKLPKESKVMLIRGLFDSEGCIYVKNNYGATNYRGNRHQNYYRIHFTNTDENILKLWKNLTTEFGFKFYWWDKRHFDLVIKSVKNIRLFRDTFYPNGFLLDKQNKKFEELKQLSKQSHMYRNGW